jgi:ATP-binding protein involved in chromosome partitioning
MDIFGSGGGLTMAKQANVPFIGTIPMDPLVRIGGDAGSPIVISNPNSAPAVALRLIAEKIAASLSVAALQTNSGVSINVID